MSDQEMNEFDTFRPPSRREIEVGISPMIQAGACCRSCRPHAAFACARRTLAEWRAVSPEAENVQKWVKPPNSGGQLARSSQVGPFTHRNTTSENAPTPEWLCSPGLLPAPT